MNTQDILDLSLEMAGFDFLPDDTRIYNPREDVQRILLGIDIDEEDLRSAKERGFDLVLAHHPPVKVGIEGVLPRHIDLMIQAGVPKAKAEVAYEKHFAYLSSRWSPGEPGPSHEHFSEVARSLDLGFMNIHLPCDEIGRLILQKTVDELPRGAGVKDLMNAFATLPEIATAGEGVESSSTRPEQTAGMPWRRLSSKLATIRWFTSISMRSRPNSCVRKLGAISSPPVITDRTPWGLIHSSIACEPRGWKWNSATRWSRDSRCKKQPFINRAMILMSY